MNSTSKKSLFTTGKAPQFIRAWLLATFAVICCGSLAQAQVTATYSPNNWTNNPYSPDTYFTLTSANTTSPTYTAAGGTPTTTQTLYAYSPIGSTITLNAPGQTITFTGQLTLSGDGSPGNNQIRYGLFYRGASPNSSGWLGYFSGNQNNAGGAGVYARQIPNTGLYGSTTGANQIGAGQFLFSAGISDLSTYNFMLSVTYVNASQTLVRWTLQGVSGNTYLYSGIQTNNTPATQGGFSFDQVGFLFGGTLFAADTTPATIQLNNMQVTVGNFGNSTWTNNASGNWSTTGNWTNGTAANGAGFSADFSQVNLAADTTATLDANYTVGSLIFGATAGSTHNWFLASSGGSILTLAPQVSVPAAAAPTIAVNQNTASILLPFVSSNGLTMSGNGTLVLGGTNTIVGSLNLNGGALNFLTLSNLPLVSGGISSINFSNGALQWASGNTLDISPLVPISFAGTAGFDTGPNNITFASSFGDSGVGGLKKLGAGTLTLNGSAAYTGTTTVNNGVLAIGTSGSIPSSTNITVISGATLDVSALSGGLTLNAGQTLAGTGTVLGNVSGASGVTIAPGVAGAGTLTVNGNLSLNGGGALNYDLANVTTTGGGVNDLTAVSGNLNISGTTTITVNLLNGAPGLGNYTLFTYGTITPGSAAHLVAPLGFSVLDTGTSIQLVVTHLPASLTWAGDGSANVWDTDTTKNWLQSGTNQYFFTGDAVTFTDAGSATPPINISSAVSPSSVTVNASQSYDFTGGAIATGQLTKNGNGTLILENNNTYNGSTLISGGSLQVGGPVNGGASGALGSGPVTNNGALVFDLAIDSSVTTNIYGTGNITNIGSAGTVTLSGSISGGSMNMGGSGTMVLSGSNSYTGPTIISIGYLQANNSSALGRSASGTVVTNGGQLYINANVNITNKLSLIGTGPAGDGALRKGGNGATTYGGVITLAGDTQIQVDGGSTLNLTNAIVGSTGATSTNLTLGAAAAGVGNITSQLNLGSGSLTKIGAGAWTIAPTNTYTGTTFLNAGTLIIPAATALGPVSTFTPAYVTFAGGTLQVTTNVTFADGLGGFTVTTTATFDVPVGLTLNISNEFSGTGAITKHDSGTLVLSGSNTFTGVLNVDGGGTAGDNGTVVIANSNAVSTFASPIAIRVSLGGNSTFALNGNNGSVTVGQDITLAGRSPSIPGILNIAGTNTLAGNITGVAGGIQYRLESDSGLLTLGGAGTFLTFTTIDPETFTFQGNGSFSVAGVIADGTAATSIQMNGNGSLTLNAVNTYSGSTTVSAGTLNGTGTIAGPVIVGAGGTFSPGAPLGTLTISNTLSLAGNTFVTVNKALSTSSQVAGLTNVSYGGTLTVTNVSGTLVSGDSFQIFPATTFTGNFSSISPALGGGLSWSFNPATGVLSVTSTINPNRPPILTTFDGTHLGLNWPTNAGWILQAQTNSVATGLGTNWVDVPGSSTVTGVTNTINRANGSVFYRLRLP